MNRAAEVLVVGAGPSGLTLALQAHAHGARVRIVERRSDALRPSRALILHPRTLEVLRPLDVTDALLARADTAPEARLHLGSRVIPVRLASLAMPETSFPHLTLIRQMDVEAVLAQALADRGVVVERGTELIEVEQTGDRGRATLRTAIGLEQTDCDFIAACDGPESTIRRAAGIRWQGSAYKLEVILADAELAGEFDTGAAHAVVGRHGLLLVFALGERATWRILATRPARRDRLSFGVPGPPVPLTELQSLLDDARLEARITDLVWSARYALQRCLATRFRVGRLFLVGDAAHASSPATGQGMNTGIQDAINLGWKLAFAPAARDPDALLNSYDLERRPVARQILMLTHLAFWAEAATGPLPSLLRGALAPLGAPMLPIFLRRRRLVAEAARVMSQLWVAYRDSPISVEGSQRPRNGPRAGDRVPETSVIANGRRMQLHTLLAQPGVHVLLQRDAFAPEHRSIGPFVSVSRLTSVPGTGLIAVRPDGYIGFRCGESDLTQLCAWLARVGAAEQAGGCDSGQSLRQPGA